MIQVHVDGIVTGSWYSDSDRSDIVTVIGQIQ
jgi:hypothetical protein